MEQSGDVPSREEAEAFFAALGPDHPLTTLRDKMVAARAAPPAPALNVDPARDALNKLILHACSYHLEAWAASERDEPDPTLIAYRDNCIQRILVAALAPKVRCG